MTAILLTLILGNWSLVGNDGWQLVEIVKPADPPRPDPPPPAPELTGCENGQCQPRRMVWRRRR